MACPNIRMNIIALWELPFLENRPGWKKIHSNVMYDKARLIPQVNPRFNISAVLQTGSPLFVVFTTSILSENLDRETVIHDHVGNRTILARPSCYANREIIYACYLSHSRAHNFHLLIIIMDSGFKDKMENQYDPDHPMTDASSNETSVNAIALRSKTEPSFDDLHTLHESKGKIEEATTQAIQVSDWSNSGISRSIRLTYFIRIGSQESSQPSCCGILSKSLAGSC